MIRKRGEPAIASTSKPIIEPPVFPDYPQNTQQTRPIAEDPDLVGNEDDEEDEDLPEVDEKATDEFDDDIENREVVIEDADDIINLDDDDEEDF